MRSTGLWRAQPGWEGAWGLLLAPSRGRAARLVLHLEQYRL